VYFGDRYFDELDSCLDDLDEGEQATAVIQPCDVARATIPSLADFIEEHIDEQFDDDYGPALSKDERQALDTMQDSWTLPATWNVRDKVRLRRYWADEPPASGYEQERGQS
jgi:hypothetical protein